MTDRRDSPIIQGPEPSGWASWWKRLREALAALRRPKADAGPRPAHAKAGAVPPAAERKKDKAALKAWREVHGRPAIWMAPFFLVFAVLFALPHLAQVIQPQAPRSLITALVAALPDPAQSLSPMIAGWLWAPWWLGLIALLLRLRAAWTAGRAMLDAVGWAMAALVVEGAAWLYFGRKALETGFSPAERSGAWQLLVAEFVFLFLTAVLFAPTSRQRIQFEQ